MMGRGGQMLAPRPKPWHGGAMNQKKIQTSRAGGAILAATIIAGAIIGNHYGQPSLGMVIGTAVGTFISVALYLYDRSRG